MRTAVGGIAAFLSPSLAAAFPTGPHRS